MLRLIMMGLVRRPGRTLLAIFALAFAVAVLAALSAFGTGYARALRSEVDGMGLQMMLVPLGCPYDAAARVLKGTPIENTLPEAALEEVRRDPAVAVAAPLFLAVSPRPEEKRADLWMGLDAAGRELKPWWRVKAGGDWFTGPGTVILGSEAAALEMREPGDKLFNPQTGRVLTVAGVLERSGTSDDHLFFLPLAEAQAMFGQPKRLTAIAIRLRDPELQGEASKRLQLIPGAQVVTLTEMMGAFLNLLGSVRVLLEAIGVIALVICGFTLFNVLLAAVLERMGELAIMRAVGASRLQIFILITAEALVLSSASTAAGLIMASAAGGWLEVIVKKFVPLAPVESFWRLTPAALGQALALGLTVALLAGCYPAWRASRIAPAKVFRGA